MLRARGAAKRCAVIRRIPIALQRGREPPPSLDSGRLADCTMAAAARSTLRRPLSGKSDFATVPVEDSRQPAAEPRTCGTDSSSAARMDRLAASLALDLVGHRNHPDPHFVCRQHGYLSL